MLSNLYLQLIINESYDTLKFLVFTLAIFIIALQSVIITNRLYNNWKTKKSIELRKRFELLLTGIILISKKETDLENWAKSKERLINHFKKNYLKPQFNRRVLVQDLLFMHRAYKEEQADLLKDLYYSLKLERTGIKLLKKGNATLKAKLIRDLTQMQVVEATPIIRKLTQHPSPLVRLEAHVSLLYFDTKYAFGLLNTSQDMSKWEMMKLFSNIKNVSPDVLPGFKHWLNAKNDSVTFFALHLVAHFKQTDSIPSVKKLLTHTSVSIRLKAMQALVDLGAYEFLEDEVKHFESKLHEEKKTIINLIGKANAHEYYIFLLSLIEYNTPDLAIEAGKSIVEFGDTYMEKFGKAIQDNMLNEQALKVFKHISDNRLILI